MDDDEEDEGIYYPDVPTVEYTAPDLRCIYGPDGSTIATVDTRPFRFGYQGTAHDDG